MMDLLMIGTLLVCFGLMKVFADFCDRQIKPKEKQEDRSMMDMIALGVITAGLGIYLVYALINPEKL